MLKAIVLARDAERVRLAQIIKELQIEAPEEEAGSDPAARRERPNATG